MKIFIDTLEFSRLIDRPHNFVLKKIQDLNFQNEIEKSKYIDKNNRHRTLFIMSKTGFVYFMMNYKTKNKDKLSQILAKFTENNEIQELAYFIKLGAN